MKKLANLAQQKIVDHKAVELMAVNGQMALSGIFPDVLLINRYADEVRHDVRQAVIVIAFHPDDFYAGLWIR